jgi:hypothetical protein
VGVAEAVGAAVFEVRFQEVVDGAALEGGQDAGSVHGFGAARHGWLCESQRTGKVDSSAMNVFSGGALENASGFDSLFLIFLKRNWIKMQHDVKNCLHYYPACNLQRNTHILSSKKAMERCGLAKLCGLEFTPAHSMKCVIAEKSSRSHAVCFDLPNSRRRGNPIFSLLRRKCRKLCFAC